MLETLETSKNYYVMQPIGIIQKTQCASPDDS